MISITEMLRQPPFLGVFLAMIQSVAVAQTNAEAASGESTYRYYCYQCHAYSGNGETQARSFLNPAPRDFTTPASRDLEESQMIDAVSYGREGTGMPSFSSVLSEAEIDAVVSYVRNAFMGEVRRDINYHSEVNGWIDHVRYKDAYDFVTGDVRMETPTEKLTSEQLRGRSLYLSACISCHEQSLNKQDDVVWELRAVSYPREHFSNRNEPIDIISGASPYALHDRPAIPTNKSANVSRGMTLYQDNCAFCHAADGTGRNWIGSFLEPHPRDFTDPGFQLLRQREGLKAVVRIGLPERSMPAWRSVLSESEIDDIVDYMQDVFMPLGGSAFSR